MYTSGFLGRIQLSTDMLLNILNKASDGKLFNSGVPVNQ